jgi:hypothetical protein
MSNGAGLVSRNQLFPEQVRAPKRAPGRRDVDSHADAVTDHGDMWQPRDQLSLWNVAISIRQVIRMEARSWLTTPPQKICADNPDRLAHGFY